MTALPVNKTYWLETYGCQMNKAESEALAIALEEAGYTPAPDATSAGLVALNTCSVRHTAEERLWGRLGHYRHLKTTRTFLLAVMGCMSERLKDDFRAHCPDIDILIGTFEKGRFLEALAAAEATGRPQDRVAGGEYEFASLHSRGSFKAFVPIMHGCNNYCAYCIVPYVRGPETSRAPDAILSELRTLRGRGVRETTLLGQNVNSYRYGENGRRTDFPALLGLVAEETPAGDWVRFLTSHPKDCSQAVIERIASSGVFCRHFHLPVQHGSDRILGLMNRGYTARAYLDLVHRIKNTVGGATITTDILVGFPSETGEDVDRTLALMAEAEFADAYTYYYNPREGTKAFAFGDTVAQDEKLRRLQKVIDLTHELKRRRNLARVGKEAIVLVEDVSRKNGAELLGRTAHDEMAVFTGPRELVGTFVRVKLLELKGTTFRGEKVN
jgi:tRNA-2-methylthio-N6-dimethylallyladenosine synthase